MGYFTTDPSRVAFLWEEVRKRIASVLTPLNDQTNTLEALNKQLECKPGDLDMLFHDESTQKLQGLLDKFNG